MTAVLVFLGLGDLAWFAHFVAHHRTGLTAALTAATGWAWRRTRRRIVNPGQRVAGRDTPKPAQKAITA